MTSPAYNPVLGILLAIATTSSSVAVPLRLESLPSDYCTMLSTGFDSQPIVEGFWEITDKKTGEVIDRVSHKSSGDGFSREELQAVRSYRQQGYAYELKSFTTTFDGVNHRAFIAPEVVLRLDLKPTDRVLHVASGHNALTATILNLSGYRVEAVDPFLGPTLATYDGYHRTTAEELVTRAGASYDKLFTFWGPTISNYATRDGFRNYVRTLHQLLKPGGSLLVMRTGPGEAVEVYKEFFDVSYDSGATDPSRTIVLTAR